jgi:hypothetical protein
VQLFNYLNEKLVSRPANLLVFLSLRSKDIDWILAEIKTIEERFNKKLKDDDFYYVMRSKGYAIIDSVSAFLFIKRYCDKLKSDIDATKRFGRDFLKYIFDDLDVKNKYNDLNRILEEINQYFKDLPQMRTMLADEKEHGGWPEDYFVFEKPVTKILTRFKEMYNLFKDKMDAWAMAMSMEYEPSTTLPPTEDIEVLYHASLYAREISKTGFERIKPENRVGVGVFGNQNNISLTYDQKIAMDISRCLKEMAMIAQGQLKLSHIKSWIDKENIDIDTTIVTYPPKDTLDLLKLYNHYLWKSKIHPNPVFANIDNDLLKSLKITDIKNIGVLKCQVNMRYPDIRHKIGESEFLVPPEAIINIKIIQ